MGVKCSGHWNCWGHQATALDIETECSRFYLARWSPLQWAMWDGQVKWDFVPLWGRQVPLATPRQSEWPRFQQVPSLDFEADRERPQEWKTRNAKTKRSPTIAGANWALKAKTWAKAAHSNTKRQESDAKIITPNRKTSQRSWWWWGWAQASHVCLSRPADLWFNYIQAVKTKMI